MGKLLFDVGRREGSRHVLTEAVALSCVCHVSQFFHFDRLYNPKIGYYYAQIFYLKFNVQQTTASCAQRELLKND